MLNIASRILVCKSGTKMHGTADVRGDDDVRVDRANRAQGGFADGLGVGTTKHLMETASAATANVPRQGCDGDARYLAQQGNGGIGPCAGSARRAGLMNRDMQGYRFKID